jgi:hypothetical protein
MATRILWSLLLVIVVIGAYIFLAPVTVCEIRRDPRHTDLWTLFVAVKYGIFDRRPSSANRDMHDMHSSWRVQALPWLDRQDLADAYQFDREWDNQERMELLAIAPDCFTPFEDLDVSHYFPSAPRRSDTWYLAVMDERTAWASLSTKQLKVSDPPSETLLLIEAPELQVPWMEPRDLSFDEAVALLSKPTKHYSDGWFSVKEYDAWREVIFCDGTYGEIPPLDRQDAIALLTRDGSEQVDLERLPKWTPSEPKVSYKTHRVITASIFVLSAMVLVTVGVYRGMARTLTS